MQKFINKYDVLRFLKVNGFKWNGTKQTSKGEVVVDNIDDFSTFNDFVGCNGIFTKLTDKNNQNLCCTIYIDNYNFCLFLDELDLSDPTNPKTILKNVKDLSNTWIEYLANKYPQYIEFAKTDLYNQELRIIKKYMENYANKLDDKFYTNIITKVYKDSINNNNNILKTITDIEKSIKER